MSFYIRGDKPHNRCQDPGKYNKPKIYPNPANDVLHIEYSTGKLEGYVRLFDMQGRLRHELPLPSSGDLTEIRVGNIPNGVYVAQWFCNGQTGYDKVIISH